MIGVLAEFDALPGITQSRSPYPDPVFSMRRRARVRAPPLRRGIRCRGAGRQGLAGLVRNAGHDPPLRNAGGGGRRGEGLHGAGRPLRRCRRRPSLAPEQRQRRQSLHVAGQQVRQVPLPGGLGARGGRARAGPQRAGRGGGDEPHGQPDARARAAGDAHPLRDHRGRIRAQRRPRLRGGVLLRAQPGGGGGSGDLRAGRAGGGGGGPGDGDEHGVRGDPRAVRHAGQRSAAASRAGQPRAGGRRGCTTRRSARSRSGFRRR